MVRYLYWILYVGDTVYNQFIVFDEITDWVVNVVKDIIDYVKRRCKLEVESLDLSILDDIDDALDEFFWFSEYFRIESKEDVPSVRENIYKDISLWIGTLEESEEVRVYGVGFIPIYDDYESFELVHRMVGSDVRYFVCSEYVEYLRDVLKKVAYYKHKDKYYVGNDFFIMCSESKPFAIVTKKGAYCCDFGVTGYDGIAYCSRFEKGFLWKYL